ncbi:MAG: amidohydrolase family protein, partial [Syntrophobacteraceae bacterium]
MPTILLKADGIVDVVGLRIVTPGALLIKDSRIAAVGQEACARAAEAEKTVDWTGKILLPGLIDCHNHLSLDPTLDNYLMRMNDSIPELTIRALRTMVVDLASGVTTSRCMGDKGFLDIVCKEAVEAGEIVGPRLIVATRGIRAPHGHGFVGYPFSGVENIRMAVR